MMLMVVMVMVVVVVVVMVIKLILTVVVFRVPYAAGRDPHLLCQRWENFL